MMLWFMISVRLVSPMTFLTKRLVSQLRNLKSFSLIQSEATRYLKRPLLSLLLSLWQDITMNVLTEPVIPTILRVRIFPKMLESCAFDAMSSDRCYRKALSIENIREEIEKNAGTEFDPEYAKAFIKLLDEGVITIKD